MPICERCNQDFPSLDKHHITSKSKGGDNSKYNITHICPNCHRLVHAGHIILEGKFMTTAGMKLIWHLPIEKSITNSSVDCHLI